VLQLAGQALQLQLNKVRCSLVVGTNRERICTTEVQSAYIGLCILHR